MRGRGGGDGARRVALAGAGLSVPWRLGIGALAQAYRAGGTDPDSVVDAYLARIDAFDGRLNCYVALNPDLRREAADSGTRLRAGAPRSALEGVPVAIKDNLVAAGMPASWGSAAFAGTVATSDELPVARLRAAGALVLGKTNTPEFAVEGYTSNRLFGTTGNAWNPDLTPGGSSGGSASAVAAGLAAAALGTDGGGSIRRPAGHTGLYGMKPTLGAVPRAGGLPQVLLDFEVVGALTRKMADLRLLHTCLAGPDRRDPMSRRRAEGPSRRAGLRILYVPKLAGAPCDPGILAACAVAAERLAALGHRVETGEMPFDLDALNGAWTGFAQVGLARLRAEMPAFAAASSRYQAMADEGAGARAAAFARGLDLVAALRAATSVFFADYDLVMTPSAAAQPWPAAEPYPPVIDGTDAGPRGHAVYTGWVNAAGLPALCLPAPRHRDGMPVGFQLVGDLFADAQLLDVGAAYEAVTGPWMWPPGWLSGDTAPAA